MLQKSLQQQQQQQHWNVKPQQRNNESKNERSTSSSVDRHERQQPFTGGAGSAHFAGHVSISSPRDDSILQLGSELLHQHQQRATFHQSPASASGSGGATEGYHFARPSKYTVNCILSCFLLTRLPELKFERITEFNA